jgi:chemotaxis protein MotB
MMRAGANAPVIIKRKKVVAGGGHHGGAWKVAYADFVTAMMAFFLLMWLLNATTEQQLKGLADYFSPVVPISRTSGGSDGMLGGDSLSAEGTLADDGRQPVHGAMGELAFLASESDGEGAAAAEVATLRNVEEVLLARGGESMLSEQALRHVVTRLTDEGLVIELFSRPDAPLFEAGSVAPRPVTVELIRIIAETTAMVTNPVGLSAHLPARPVVSDQGPAWDLSTDRADAVRMLLEASGMPSSRIARVTGHADRDLADQSDPTGPRNDRIEIVLLREVR